LPYQARSYANFQLIGYEIPTARLGKAGSESSLPKVQYMPVPTKAVSDIDARTRLKRLAAVVDYAKQQVEMRGTSASTLKVFMAPEFYFRPASIPKAAWYDEKPGVELMTAIEGLFADASLRDWMFLPGTVLWKDTAHIPSHQKAVPPLSPVIRNTAVMVKGGPEAPSTRVNKMNTSDVDGIPAQLWPKNNILVSHLRESIESRRKALLEVDGITFGVEICKDHSLELHTLKTTRRQLVGKADTEYLAKKLQFHMLTSCGVGLNPTSVASDEWGWLLRSEGNPNYFLDKRSAWAARVTWQQEDDIDLVDQIVAKQDVKDKTDTIKSLDPRTKLRTDIVTSQNPTLIDLPSPLCAPLRTQGDQRVAIYDAEPLLVQAK